MLAPRRSLATGTGPVLGRLAALAVTIVISATACGGATTTTAPSTPTAAPPAGETPAQTTATSAFPESPLAADDAGPLALLEWSGYEIPDFTNAFTSKFPDVKLDYQFADGGASFFSKVQTGRGRRHRPPVFELGPNMGGQRMSPPSTPAGSPIGTTGSVDA